MKKKKTVQRRYDRVFGLHLLNPMRYLTERTQPKPLITSKTSKLILLYFVEVLWKEKDYTEFDQRMARHTMTQVSENWYE